MPLPGLLGPVARDSAIAAAVRAAGTGDRPRLDLTAPPGLRPFALAAIARQAGRPLLAVTATGRECDDLAAGLRALLGSSAVAEFPAWETLPHERLSPRSDTVGRRLAVLRRLTHPGTEGDEVAPRIVVAPVRAVLQPQVAGLGDLEPVRVTAGEEIELDEVVRRLGDAAYLRTDLVEKRGDFAVRGGILDIFPPTEEHPLRLEFWGDQIEEIRYFKVADQRSLEVAPHGLWAPPCREMLLTDTVRKRAHGYASEFPALADVFGKIAEGIAVEGMESLAPVLVDRMELLIDLLPPDTHIVSCDPERVRARAADLVRTSQEFLDASWAAAAMGAAAPLDLDSASLWSLTDVREHARRRGLPWWSVSPFVTDEELSQFSEQALDTDDSVRADAVAAPEYRGDTSAALADVRAWLREGWRVVLVTEGHGPAERLVEVAKGADLGARLDIDLPDEPEPGVLHVATGSIERGFVLESARLAVLTETDIAGQRSSTRDMRRMPSRRRNMVDPLQLRAGDFVVHEQHGVGRYVEMVQRTVAGATREYLVIEYAASKRGQPGDRLFVPTDQLEQVTKYVGGESPSLHRLGGADWHKAKSRARKAVREIAGDLIKLYSARMAAPGYAFGSDTPWQRELEDAFPYVETPDQLACIDEVKADMEKSVPMDRLICGDVGYGKTEIAVRAAFKAVQDGKQVAVLVPTTLLVQQHFSTFAERYAQFPVNIKALSRFQTDKEATEVLRGLTEGTVDIVIGTHRLFSKEAKFKDLGLVIVDEEQRFGVEHKEYLKQMRANVDVLTMSATPIPRTLEMAVTGIREMSTIQTPPEERHPVLTFVGSYEEKQIAAAIRRELLREGQVFYIHNRVESINRAAARLQELVPEARIAIAHGQMNEHTLERLIVDFWNREFDVLVCTTIVESGIDISNANTLIVERADVFGLSQLHQLRGRVGRGRERAYAYFLYPPEKPLTETAHERLATIAQHTDLGAGMYVAMKDLEIRGAGNLLGGEQSGHIEGVGFDLYMRMVGEAVADFRALAEGRTEPEQVDVRVDLPIDAHIPHDWVPDERLRLEAYRRIASITDSSGVTEVHDELVDRYGQLPVPVGNLLAVALFRAHARSAGLTEVAAQGNYVKFAPVELRESQLMRLQRVYPKSLNKAATHTILVPKPMTQRIGGQPVVGLDLLAWCRELIDNVLLM
ncbi:transcription-repair coupling factor [Actinocrinis puniceicyclus]|uniref:Transcription-repair-coupling factor n=1 Tax=Actinocrinis puniceicyclus TaxID=977794 RepID=A0A8J7WHU6_9ACTN|nr:transcription-repair coupling factor [Actinocrinis puniceicyclus]MBS2962503.1 transcription-repair coupling factor [Actinocrinis puniceicyclus]